MTTVYLIRHGETEWNALSRIQGRQDIELNEKGRKQAKRCGEYLRNKGKENWDAIVSSPLVRAKETAMIIAGYLSHSAVIVMDELQERDYGSASGLTRAEVEERFPDQSIPDLESFEDLTQRGLKGLSNILERYRNKKVIVVAHGALINALLHRFSKGEIGTGKTALHNACLTIAEYDEGWKIKEYNCIAHLQEEPYHTDSRK